MDRQRLIATGHCMKEAENLVETLKPLGITFKVGLELFCERPQSLKLYNLTAVSIP